MKSALEVGKIQWRIPKYIILTGGSSNGETELTAFDKALLDAGIGDLNLVKVTSILPPYGEVFRLEEIPFDLPKGALIHAVYTRSISATYGAVISSAIGVGVPVDEANSGMIFEVSILGPKQKAQDMVQEMIAEAFRARGINLKESIIVASEMETSRNIGCTVAAALLLSLK